MAINIYFPLLIFISFFSNYVLSQELDEDVMKAVSCISLIKKMGNKNQDQRYISSIMLTCFINIDEKTTQKLMASQYSNNLDIDQSEIDRLTDMSLLQSKYSQNEILDYSKQLNSALEKLKTINEGGRIPTSQEGKSKSSKSKNSGSGAGLIGFLISNILGLLNPNDSFLFLVGIFVMAYFGLKGLRKLLGGNNKKTNKKKGKKD